MLIAYAQAAPSDRLRIWVGIFDDPNPAPLVLRVDASVYSVVELAALRPIRDGMTDGSHAPLNHRAVYEIVGLEPGRLRQVTVEAGRQKKTVSVSTMPSDLPETFDPWFHVLLCSCYSQPQDASGVLGKTIERIMTRPNLTLMMGDQIYGDLPIKEDLPRDTPGVARTLGAKYLRNWLSSALGTGGLASVLARAPVMCVADDHEYWNNFPFRQAQLPKTWSAGGRDQWEQVARELYEDYQLAGPAGSAQRLDIGPLRMITVDMRTRRDGDLKRLMSDRTASDILDWEQSLRKDRAQGVACFGLLCSGQSLFAPSNSAVERSVVDAEMANYEEFDTLIVPMFERLAEAGIPVLYITGDVHWGRVAQARYRLSHQNQPMIYEVIASPSSLICTPSDPIKQARARFLELGGDPVEWPLHGKPAEVPDKLGKSTRFQLECDLKSGSGYGRQGNQVAVLSLCKAGGGIDFKVTYYAVSKSDSMMRPHSTPVYSMRNL
jgi:hypothetical protein